MPSGLSILVVFLLAFLPSMGWMMVYRYLDHRDPEPLRPTVFALLAGVCSTIPVFALQVVFSQYPDFNLVSLLQDALESPLFFSAAFLLFVAVVEETAKALAFLITIRRREKHFNQVVDGIVYGALVGIGFALAENMYYFWRALDTFSYSSSFLAIFTIRSFGTMLAHTLFTGLFGFYFAKAYFAPFIDEESKNEKLWHNFGHNLRQAVRLHVTFFHLLPIRAGEPPQGLKRNAIIFEGYVVAILIHFLYNALIKLEVFGKNWTFLIIPLLFLVAWSVWSRFFIQIYTRILDFIRMKRDLYRLRVH